MPSAALHGPRLVRAPGGPYVEPPRAIRRAPEGHTSSPRYTVATPSAIGWGDAGSTFDGVELHSPSGWSGASPDVVTIRPRDGFMADTRYRVTTPAGECPARVTGGSQAFRTGGPAPLPTTLGTLTATAPAQANVQQRMFVGGQCAYEASAMTSVVSVALSAEATPWASMLRRRTSCGRATQGARRRTRAAVRRRRAAARWASPMAGPARHGRSRGRCGCSRVAAWALGGAPSD